MSLTLDEFYHSFYEELDTARRNDSLVKVDDFFTNLMFEYLQDLGEVEDPVVCSYRDNSGIQLNGFAFSDDYYRVDLFVSLFTDTDALLSIPQGDVTAALKRCLNCYRRAMSGNLDQFRKDTDVFDCVNTMAERVNEIREIKVTVLTNGVVKSLDLPPSRFSNATVTYNVWDMDRLFKASTSGTLHEPITVNFAKYSSEPLYAVKGLSSPKTQVYLAIIPGQFLADIYNEFGAKLLERNVRSFLQLKGKVNKGIRETLISEPDMFLAYNNGITVTASSIVVEEEGASVVKINEIHDFQIVNGGQTTVSLFKAKTDRNSEVDFSQVYVQMKLAVVENAANMDEIVPNISRYSNSQNSVQVADFSSNDPYQRKLEALSRATWSPTKDGQKPVNWFYERTRGQYAEQLNSQPTPAKRRDYKDAHPLITKTDLAKALLSWEQMPTAVALGAQKCFAIFLERQKNSTLIDPDLTYYQRCVAKIILFRRIEKLVLDQRFGGYKADIVAYSYYKLLRMTGGKLDLDAVWAKQAISSATEEQIIEIVRAVQPFIVNAPNGGNISEFCKTQKCVTGVDALPLSIIDSLKVELLAAPISETVVQSSSGGASLTPEEKAVIEEAEKISGDEWKSLAAWAKDKNLLLSWQRSLLFSLATLKWRNKTPTYKQAYWGLEARAKALTLGFRME